MKPLPPSNYEHVLKRSSWTLLGLPSTLGFRVFLLFILPSSISPLFLDRPELGGSWSYWIGLLVAADAIFATCLLLGRQLVHGDDVITSRPIATLVVLVFAQAARGTFIGEMTVHSGLSESPLLLFRVGYGSFFIGSVLVIAAILVALSDQNRDLEQSLLTTTNKLEDLNRTLQIRIDETNSNLIKYVRDTVIPRIHELDSLLVKIRKNSDQMQAVASMSEFIDGELRPLSHQLVNDFSDATYVAKTEPSDAKSAFWPDTIFLSEALRPVISSLVLFIALLSGATRSFDRLELRQYSLYLAITILPILLVTKKLCHAIELKLKLATALIVVFYAAFALAIVLGERLVGNNTPDGMLVPSIIVGAAMGLANVGYSILTARRTHTISELIARQHELNITLGVLRQHAWRARHRLAYAMHGSLLSAVYAATIKLGQDENATQQTIDEIRKDISLALNKLVEFEPAHESFEIIRDRLTQVWAGVIDVDWQLSNAARIALTNSGLLAECAGEVIRESLSNASRHGSATSACVTLDWQEDQLMLVVDDNGNGIESDWDRGLGHLLYDELCTIWLLEQNVSGGTRFSAHIADS